MTYVEEAKQGYKEERSSGACKGNRKQLFGYTLILQASNNTSYSLWQQTRLSG